MLPNPTRGASSRAESLGSGVWNFLVADPLDLLGVNHIEQPLGQFLHDSIEVVTLRDGGGHLKQGAIAEASQNFLGATGDCQCILPTL